MVVRTVEPDLVLRDRAAEIGVSLPEQQVRVVALLHACAVGGTHVAACGDVTRRAVAADEAARLVRDVFEPLERIAAALDGRHDRRARRIHFDVAAERADRHLFVRVEVLVEPGAAHPFGVIDPVGDDLRLILNAEALVTGLLALVAAADVESRHPDARRFRQRSPDVRRAGNRDQRFAFEARPHSRRRHIDDRRVSGDGEALRHAANLHLRVGGDRLTEDHDNVVAFDLFEAWKIEHELVRARRHAGEQVLSVTLGHRSANADQCRRRRRHHHTRQHRALRVGHDTGQTALADLRERRRCADPPEDRDHHDPHCFRSHGSSDVNNGRHTSCTGP